MLVVVTAGPSAGRAVELSDGRHLVGRASGCAVALADPEVEAHHAVVSTVGGRVVDVTQLASRTPLWVDGRRHVSGPVRPGASLVLGVSRLRLGRPTVAPAAANSRWAVLAAVERATYLARADAPWVVELGRGSVRLPLPRRGVADLDDLAALAAHEVHDDLPVLADLAPRRRYTVAVRGLAAPQMVAAIRAQLPAAAPDRDVIVGWGADDPGRAHTRLVLLDDGEPVPAGCDALLDVSARWRGTWEPDRRAPSLGAIRFHAAGGTRRIAAEQIARA